MSSKTDKDNSGGAPGQGPPPGSPLGVEPTVFFAGYPSPSKPTPTSSRLYLNLEQTVYLDLQDSDILRHIVEDSVTGKVRLFVRAAGVVEVGQCFKGISASTLFPLVFYPRAN